jgi:FAD/FMN-containing dehydrogenase
MLNVGYHIAQDRSSLFSYTRDWPALPLAPVASGRGGWEDFLVAYNAFCAENNGRPLFNQTGSLTPEQAAKSFGPEIRAFQKFRARIDPDGRFFNEYFRNLFSQVQ